jgi:hypothetical protein
MLAGYNSSTQQQIYIFLSFKGIMRQPVLSLTCADPWRRPSTRSRPRSPPPPHFFGINLPLPIPIVPPSLTSSLSVHHRVHIAVEMKLVEGICPLSWSVHWNCNFVSDGNRLKGGAPPILTSQGRFFHHDVRQKSAIATLCVLCGVHTKSGKERAEGGVWCLLKKIIEKQRGSRFVRSFTHRLNYFWKK